MSLGGNARFVLCSAAAESRAEVFASDAVYFRWTMTSRGHTFHSTSKKSKLFITGSVSRLWSMSAQWEGHSPRWTDVVSIHNKSHRAHVLVVPERHGSLQAETGRADASRLGWVRRKGKKRKGGLLRRAATNFVFWIINFPTDFFPSCMIEKWVAYFEHGKPLLRPGKRIGGHRVSLRTRYY